MEPEHKILVIEDDKALSTSLSDILKEKGYEVVAAENYENAKLYMDSAHIVIVDLRLPDKPGIEVVKELKDINPEAEVLIVTGYADVQSAIDACNLGAFAYLKKPITPERLLLFLKRALERRQLALEVKRREQEIKGLTSFTGEILNERVSLLEEANAQEERLNRLYRGIDLAFYALNPLDAAKKLLPLIAKETRANHTSLNVIGTDGKLIDREDYFNGMEPFAITIRAGGSRETVIRTKKPLIVPDLSTFPDPNPGILGAGIKSFCIYPLVLDDIVCGSLVLCSLSKNGFEGMEEFIASFANLCAIPLRQSIIFMETERIRKIWEATVNILNVGIAITDQDRNIVMANKHLADMVKVPLEDLPGKKVCSVIHGHPYPEPECPMEKARKSGEPSVIVMKENFLNMNRLQIRIAPIKNARREITHFVHALRDLDDSQKAG